MYWGRLLKVRLSNLTRLSILYRKSQKALMVCLCTLKLLHTIFLFTILFLFCQVFSNDVEDFADSVEIDFLHYTSCCFWEFPKECDKKIISSKFVFFGPCIPSETTKRGYKFVEDAAACAKYKNIKKGFN